jgi:hypothetical protein
MDIGTMRTAEVAPLRDAHPLDVIEAVASEHEWSFERSGEDEIAISASGQLSAYTISYSWMEDCEALHLACAFDMKVPRNRAGEVGRLVALINEQLLMGHFDFWQKENVIMFRQTLVLAGGLDPTERQVEALFDSAVETCDTYFAAFQFVVWSGLTGREAIETVLFETVGTA